MNERIDELAFEAGCQRYKYWDPKHPDLEGFIISQAALDKFAELIVRECIQSIENTIETNCDTDSEKIGCEFAITDLKEHFGVEE